MKGSTYLNENRQKNVLLRKKRALKK